MPLHGNGAKLIRHRNEKKNHLSCHISKISKIQEVKEIENPAYGENRSDTHYIPIEYKYCDVDSIRYPAPMHHCIFCQIIYTHMVTFSYFCIAQERDLPPSKLGKKRKNFFERDVCKFYLAGLCPYYELFKNTKSDLGPCQYRIHDGKFKDQYFTLNDDVRNNYGFEQELFRKLQDLVRDMDRKIAKNRKRADEENAAKIISKDQQIILDDLISREKSCLKSSQNYGELGNVDLSIQAAQVAERIKIERENLEQRLKFPGGRIMFVCGVCGVFINNTDNEARRADHYNGKQYLGWKAIRDKLKELETKIAQRRSALK